MTPRQLKAAAAREPVQVRVVSDGCRDYVVEALSPTGAGLLRDRSGRALRFRNLGQVHRVLKRCGVRHTVLRQRVADDEACAGEAAFHDLPLALPH